MSEKDKNTLCMNRAVRALDSSESYFNLYQSDKLKEKCIDEIDSKFTICALKFQKQTL